MSQGSRTVVYAALLSNIAIAIAKFIVAAISGSSAMLAEAVHSSVDTINQLLLLVGMRRSQMPASPSHPFGHGRELYFWSFVVVIMLFAFGGGLSVLEGINHVRHPETLQPAKWNYIVLGLSFLFEGTSWIVGLRELFAHRRAGRGILDLLRYSKDPNVMGVVFEDSAALVGIVLAAMGVWSSHFFHRPELDGAASIAIGILLAAVAFLFGREVMGLLIGEAADPEVIKAIREVTAHDADIESAGDPLTMQLAPNQVLLNIELRFRKGLDRDGIELAIDRIESEIRKRAPEVTRIYIEAESLKPRNPSAPTPLTPGP